MGRLGLRTIGIAVVGCAGIAVVAALLVGAPDGPADPVSTPRPTEAAAAVATYPFDDVPGFGRFDRAVRRDDTIAMWEAYRRDVRVHRCMGRAGFDWQLEGFYEPHTGRWLARENGLEVPADGGRDPEQRNYAYEQALSDAQRDGYLRALIGEPAWAIDYAIEHHDEAPPSRAKGFARGGCKGTAAQTIPRIWDLEASLANPLQRLRIRTRDLPPVEEVAAYELFRFRHRVLFDVQERTYVGAMGAIRRDRGFLTWLGKAVARGGRNHD